VSAEGRYKTAAVAGSTAPEWNETATLPVGDVERAQLECSLWDESDPPKQARPPAGPPARQQAS
jgi:hypothetical protein